MPAKQPERRRSLDLIDIQASGDVSRIVLSGVEALPGNDVREQQRYLEEHGDGLRRLLLSEPYGDPSQSVNLIVRPGASEAHAGYIIMEAMGYPMYSGSNTICTATALLQSGRIPMHDGDQTVLLESPAGVARVRASCANGLVQSVTTEGEAAYLAVTDLEADITRYGKVRYDLVWSGGFYALIDAEALGFQLVRDEESALAAFAHAFVETARPQLKGHYPSFADEHELAFVHFMRPASRADGGFRARSTTYVHPHVICRSPTGTGTSARLALMAERGEIESGEWLETISPRDSRFTGTLLDDTQIAAGCRGWQTQITGRAWTLARAETVIDLDDPLVDNRDLEPLLTRE